MREDMAKVLVERPRLGGDRAARKGYRKQLGRAMAADNTASRERIKARSGGGKFFNEHLGPLRRFLDSQVGRPWNLVLSEISKHVDRGSVVQKHILTHLFEYVETQPVLINGVPHYPPHRRYRQTVIAGRYAWYVCPKTGLLKRAPHKASTPRKPPTRHWISNEQFCELTAYGGWILVTVRAIPETGPAEFDIYLRRTLSAYDKAWLENAYGKPVRAVTVKHLTKAEALMLPIPIHILRPIVQNRV